MRGSFVWKGALLAALAPAVFFRASGMMSDVTRIAVSAADSAPVGQIRINNGAMRARKQAVKLSLSGAASSGLKMRFNESAEGLQSSAWLPFSQTFDFVLSGGDGSKVVYAQLRDAEGRRSIVRSLVDNLGAVAGKHNYPLA